MKASSNIKEFFCKFFKWLFPAHALISNSNGYKTRLEPKYWPEVIHFLDNINAIVKTHTIEDNNIQIVNERIIDYMAKEINLKGSIEDVEKRYDALNTLADRILVNNLSKIVGLKQTETKIAYFTTAVEQFKKDLEKRHLTETISKADKH